MRAPALLVHRSFISVIILLGSLVSANGLFPRTDVSSQTTDSGLVPWVTVNSDGISSTVTPVVKTLGGARLTISENPAAITATTTSSATEDSAATTTSTTGLATATPAGDEGPFKVCHNTDGEFAPFCKPSNGSQVFVGETYYVTWDPSYYSITEGANATVLIIGYHRNSSALRSLAFTSPITANSYGFISWKVEKDWLETFSSNNLTLFIAPLNAAVGTNASSVEGPTVMVTTSPVPEPTGQPASKSHRSPALYIGLPIVLAFLILCAMGGFFVYRKRQHHDGSGSSIGGGSGYGVRKSRSQRLGKNEVVNDIELRKRELRTSSIYTAPLPPVPRSAGLGS